MKTKDIIITILVITLIALGVFTLNLYQENDRLQNSFNFSGINENMKIESINQLQKEYEEVILELEAEDFLNNFQTDGIAEALSIDDLKTELNSIDEFRVLDDVKKCRIMKRWLRKQKCKPKRKLYRGVVSKTKIGSISYAEGKIAINAPQIIKFKDEVNRINVLMETYYNLRSSFCDSQGFCHTNALLMACVSSTNPVFNEAYIKCAELYTGNVENKFVGVLKLLFENIEKFNDKKMTEAEVKAVAEAELEDIKQSLEVAEKEQKVDVEQPKDTINN